MDEALLSSGFNTWRDNFNLLIHSQQNWVKSHVRVRYGVKANNFTEESLTYTCQKQLPTNLLPLISTNRGKKKTLRNSYLDLTKEVERSRTSPSEHRPTISIVPDTWSVSWAFRLPVACVEGDTRVVVGRHEELLPILTMASLSHTCF